MGAVDTILQAQAAQDTDYFIAGCGRVMGEAEAAAVQETVLRAYRWQYIVSGVQVPRFGQVLAGLITTEQADRIHAALAPLMA